MEEILELVRALDLTEFFDADGGTAACCGSFGEDE